RRRGGRRPARSSARRSWTPRRSFPGGWWTPTRHACRRDFRPPPTP
ncbi:MAG: hypothetical protein AVDCRST_MAG68-1209, partial [uncultured Gemmatimonadetes bacterium]